MARPKVITKLIRTCRECPHGSYYSGGAYECEAANNKRFPDREAGEKVQPWCPLDDAPASLT